MSTILFCEASPTLHLGPGKLEEEETIHFVNGYAEIADEDPHYDEKMRWVRVTADPKIDVLQESDRGRIVPGLTTHPFECNECGKSFETEKARNMHRLGAHRPR